MVPTIEGIIGSSNDTTLSIDYSTGDCDFEPYSSLSFCSSCKDVTSAVQEHYGTAPLAGDDGMEQWNHTLPMAIEDYSQLSHYDAKVHPKLYTQGAISATPTHAVLCPNEDYRYKSAMNLGVLSISWANCTDEDRDTDPNTDSCEGYPAQLAGLADTAGLVAMNCTMGLCVRDYVGRVRNGVFQETTTGHRYASLDADDISGLGRPTDSVLREGAFQLLKLLCAVDRKVYDISNMSQAPQTPGRNYTTFVIDGRNVTAPLQCVPPPPALMYHEPSTNFLRPASSWTAPNARKMV